MIYQKVLEVKPVPKKFRIIYTFPQNVLVCALSFWMSFLLIGGYGCSFVGLHKEHKSCFYLGILQLMGVFVSDGIGLFLQ